jgi:hypothetical protein
MIKILQVTFSQSMFKLSRLDLIDVKGLENEASNFLSAHDFAY